MKSTPCILLFFLLVTASSFAQKTREHYFQQEVHYTISVKLDDVNHMLRGYETIQYINHSPHVLQKMYFHLWPNAYRNDETALATQQKENGDLTFHFANRQAEYGYIDSLLFVVDNDTVKWEYDSAHIDICLLHLKNPLQPGDTAIISTPFVVKLPADFSRLGHVGQSYQITQWYPKPAVYDHNGWNPMPYLDLGEFYSEYGSFDVSITVPRNYVVAATGDLQTPEEEKWLETRAKETKTLMEQNRINKIGNLNGPWADDFPESDTKWKTIRYQQKNVHDFAWFADKRFYVLRGEYNLPKSGRNVTLWSYFLKNNSRYWVKSTQYLHDAIKYYSMWNGEYPYNVVSAVDGALSAGGGMEYPTITVIGNVHSDNSLETVIMHEVGHNWFYGILGSNERKHPWMDEGLNSFNEMRYIETKYPELSLIGSFAPGQTGLNKTLHTENIKQRYQYQLSYFLQAARNADQSIEEEAANYTPFNYAAIVYHKTAISFDYLRHYLGEKTFDRCMKEYYERWKFKHPEPEDLHAVFEEVSHKDLDWFFADYINSDNVIDYSLKRKKRVDRTSSKTLIWMKFEESLVVKNHTGTIAPFVIQGIRADTVAAEMWYEGFKGKKTVNFPNGPYDYFKIDFDHRMPDVNRNNNMLKEKGLFKRMEKPLLQFGGTIDDGTKSIINYLPVIGFNDYDGLMGGIAFYNTFLPQKKLEWKIMPMFGLKSKLPVGSARIDYHITPRKSNFINNVDLFYSINHYSIDINNDARTGNFYKYSYGADIRLKKKKARSKNNHVFSIRTSQIDETEQQFCQGCSDGDELNYIKNYYFHIYTDFSYSWKKEDAIRPWSLYFNTEHGLEPYVINSYQKNQFLRFSLTWNYKLIYNADKKALEVRAFAGKFLYNHTLSSRYSWRMDGQHGYHDYSYNEIFPARFETEKLFSHQFIENHGAIKVPTAHGQSIDMMAAINLKSDLPIPVLRVFADAGVSLNPGADAVMVYDAGISVRFFKGFSEVFIPVLISGNVKKEYDANGYNFAHRIRFTFNLASLAPHQRVKNIPF